MLTVVQGLIQGLLGEKKKGNEGGVWRGGVIP